MKRVKLVKTKKSVAQCEDLNIIIMSGKLIYSLLWMKYLTEQ
jgi:hypothetical protein